MKRTIRTYPTIEETIQARISELDSEIMKNDAGMKLTRSKIMAKAYCNRIRLAKTAHKMNMELLNQITGKTAQQ